MSFSIKSLEWEEDELGWWCARPAAMIGGCGYEIRVTDRGKVRSRRGRDDWAFFDGTLAEAKAAAQADFEARIRSALLPASAEPVAIRDVLIAELADIQRCGLRDRDIEPTADRILAALVSLPQSSAPDRGEG